MERVRLNIYGHPCRDHVERVAAAVSAFGYPSGVEEPEPDYYVVRTDVSRCVLSSDRGTVIAYAEGYAARDREVMEETPADKCEHVWRQSGYRKQRCTKCNRERVL